MVERKVELEPGRSRIFAVRIELHDCPKGAHRIHGDRLVATHVVDLVVMAERDQVLRVCGVLVRRVEIQVTLRRRAAVVVLPSPVKCVCRHDDRSFRPLRIRVEALNFAEQPRGFDVVVVVQFPLGSAVDFVGRLLLERRRFFLAACRNEKAANDYRCCQAESRHSRQPSVCRLSRDHSRRSVTNTCARKGKRNCIPGPCPGRVTVWIAPATTGAGLPV